MLTKKQELAMLQEITRIFKDSLERVASYNRLMWGLRVFGWLLIFVAFLLSFQPTVSIRLCLILALVGGVSSGLSIAYSSTLMLIPCLVRFAILQDEAIQKRVAELKAEVAG